MKSRDITLLTKVHIVKATIFQVVVYSCQSWTVRKDEHQGIDAFELWCWRRFLRIPWTARRSNQSILKEINPEYSAGNTDAEAEAPVFDHLMQTADSLEKSLMLGKIESRRRGCQRMRWMDGITNTVGMHLGKLWEIVRDGEAWHAAGHGVTKSWT